jgi:hypothetical protein
MLAVERERAGRPAERAKAKARAARPTPGRYQRNVANGIVSRPGSGLRKGSWEAQSVMHTWSAKCERRIVPRNLVRASCTGMSASSAIMEIANVLVPHSAS